MIKKGFYFIAMIGMFSLFSGCDIINPSEQIPAYLYIDDFQFEVDPQREGSDSRNIVAGWLTVNGEFLGAYELPALVPVLATGTADIRIQAGILDNGVTLIPEIYPFYTSHDVVLDLAENEVDTIRPSIGYEPNTQFAFIEDFESDNHLFQDIIAGDGDHVLVRSNEDVFEGNFSGRINLDSAFTQVIAATLQRYKDLNSTNINVYLEVDFKSDVPVAFGLIGHSGLVSGTAIAGPGFLPSETWDKIYLNLTPQFLEGTFDEHQVTFQAVIPFLNGQPTLSTAKVYMDNIKLVHF